MTGFNPKWHDEELFAWRGMLWTSAKLRKPSECWVTGEKIVAGDKAYRPISNGKHRMRRLSRNTVDASRAQPKGNPNDT